MAAAFDDDDFGGGFYTQLIRVYRTSIPPEMITPELNHALLALEGGGEFQEAMKVLPLEDLHIVLAGNGLVLAEAQRRLPMLPPGEVALRADLNFAIIKCLDVARTATNILIEREKNSRSVRSRGGKRVLYWTKNGSRQYYMNGGKRKYLK